MLTETAAAINDATLTSEQLELLSRYKEKATRGRDIWVRRDGLTNPLVKPPNDTKNAKSMKNVRKYKARTLNTLHRDKCRNETITPYNGKTGKEWVTTSRAWYRHFGDDVSKYRWCRGGSETEVPDLKQVLMLRSDKQRPQRGVTIVTQLSLERMSMLEQQCAHWPHPIAAVVYIPVVRGKIFSGEDDDWHLSPIERGIDAMTVLYERMRSLQCILDMEVVVEERCSNDLASMYPTNAVRNRALFIAQTEIVLLLDVDFVVDLSLVTSLENEKTYQELKSALDNHNALVLPAFEAWDQSDWGKKLALDAVKQGKQFITQKFMYNVVIGFHMSHYPQGHEKTNYWRWINTTRAYKVQYQLGFEPYILMSRKFVPYYDERFRGYYWNKVEHLMHISLQNRFSFVIHPTSFVVHVPHRKPSTKWRTKRSGQKERNHVMFLEALEDMKRDRFVPVTAFPHLCLPPAMQDAASKVVGNQDQKIALEEMATVAAPLHEEIASLTVATQSSSVIPHTKRGVGNRNVIRNSNNVDDAGKHGGDSDGAAREAEEPRGELSKQERPIIAAAEAQKEKAKIAEQALAAQELKQDLEELAAAEAKAIQDLMMPDEEQQAEEEAAAEEAREMSQTVQMILEKEQDALDALVDDVDDTTVDSGGDDSMVELVEEEQQQQQQQQDDDGDLDEVIIPAKKAGTKKKTPSQKKKTSASVGLQ